MAGATGNAKTARAAGEAGRDERRRGARPQTMVLGLLAAPGVAHELAERLAPALPDSLSRAVPSDARWRVEVREEPMAAASVRDVDLVDVAYRRLLDEGWDFAICLTENPVLVDNRPVAAHASPTHGVGLVSVPALGAVDLEDRLREVVIGVVEGLLGGSFEDADDAEDAERDERMRTRLEDLAGLRIGRPQVSDNGIRFVTEVGLGNLRLLIGMVRANRPHRLIVGLSRAVVGALSVDIFVAVSVSTWYIADRADWPRLLAACLLSVLITCTTLIAAHGLWWRTYSSRPDARARVALFNLTTTITVAIGVLTLYLALFAINVGAALVLLTTDLLESQLGHPVDFATYLSLAWLVSSLATIGGALGAGLENDRAVREAAYGYHPDARTESLDRDRS